MSEELGKKAYPLLLSNCPANLIDIVEKEIQDECKNMLVKHFITVSLPGVSKLYVEKEERKNIYSKTKLFL